MRNRNALLPGAAILLVGILPPDLMGQACFGRTARMGRMAVTGVYEPQVKGFGGAVDWNPPGVWSLRLEGGSVGEFISEDELEARQEWTRIGTVVEGVGEDRVEYPIATRRTGENLFGAQLLAEMVRSGWSVCAAGAVQGFSGEATFQERVTFLEAIGPRWMTGTQDYSGVRAPLSLASGHEGLKVGPVDLIPYAALTYWVDRVTFDRVDRGFSYEGWFGQVGATLQYESYHMGLSHRTGDDLRDGSVMVSLGYLFSGE